ncbi:MAG: winged helix-turn-helix domain-containing protein [Candidatus Nanohaloarchaea archaeon]|nr:winged helix-turn-helix domain-containing protein [Candidatus Nanohaloarchaea archaeon]
MSDEEFWECVGFVRRSRTRKEILQHLQESGNPLTPTDLSQRLGKDMKNVSRELSKLSDRGEVECVNPDAANMRMYRITDRGSDVMERVTAIEQEQAEYEE